MIVKIKDIPVGDVTHSLVHLFDAVTIFMLFFVRIYIYEIQYTRENKSLLLDQKCAHKLKETS